MQSWSQQASLCSPMGVLPPATHMQRAFSTPHIHAELTSSSEMISQQQQSHRGVVYPESSMSIPCQSVCFEIITSLLKCFFEFPQSPTVLRPSLLLASISLQNSAVSESWNFVNFNFGFRRLHIFS